jgi:dihydroflavonol-4-reductase
VHDAARGLLLALDKGVPGRGYLLAGENLTNREFMALLAEVAGTAPPRVPIPRAALALAAGALEGAADHVTRRHPPVTRGMAALVGRYLWYDGARAREELGFTPVPVRGAVERAVAWFRSAAR